MTILAWPVITEQEQGSKKYVGGCGGSDAAFGMSLGQLPLVQILVVAMQ